MNQSYPKISKNLHIKDPQKKSDDFQSEIIN